MKNKVDQSEPKENCWRNVALFVVICIITQSVSYVILRLFLPLYLSSFISYFFAFLLGYYIPNKLDKKPNSFDHAFWFSAMWSLIFFFLGIA
ncbi:hypothetical protein JK635_08305 [Neobacillus sp. YIM B02564]|uniref:Uncharacterized protein n=1 Tax=Neobacillus paridis TaxID=2803862 RepID=A0ABS1TLN8_9BACI|nr:hypothetical protein [Neobacillus paridis]MBL4952210.1 hypothetical protein [Neobacillus paridis]